MRQKSRIAQALAEKAKLFKESFKKLAKTRCKGRYDATTVGAALYYVKLGKKIGGGKRDRTADLLHAMQALSQLSYGPLLKPRSDGSDASGNRNKAQGRARESSGPT